MNKQYKWIAVLICLLLLSNLSYTQKIKTDSLYRCAMREIMAQNKGITLQQENKKMAKAMSLGGAAAYSCELFGVAGGASAGTLLMVGAGAFLINSVHEAIVFSGKNRADLYPAIANALQKSPTFSSYKIILIDAPHVTNATKQALIQFLTHPKNEIPMEKLERNNVFRFYIMPYNRQAFADVDTSRKIIFIRSSSLNPSHKKLTNHFIEAPKKK